VLCSPLYSVQLLVGAPDSTGLAVGCKQTEGLFVDGNTGAVLGCLRVQWSVCVDGDCGGGDMCGCGDASVFNNPRCGVRFAALHARTRARGARAEGLLVSLLRLVSGPLLFTVFTVSFLFVPLFLSRSLFFLFLPHAPAHVSVCWR
jgi:hypothetical protein